jgi:single-stranded-DNA-specific exonuclease
MASQDGHSLRDEALPGFAKAWHLLPYRSADAERLGRRLGLYPIVAQLLLNRGLEDPDRITRFLAMPFRGLLDPGLLPGTQQAAERLMAAVRAQERICIYGDYDVDGLTGTVILWELLRRLGAVVDFYVPNRLEEGYGLHQRALAQIAESGTRLVVTVDCGIANVTEALEARRLGLELIVTDHHEARPVLPAAAVIIHPRLSPGAYPFGDLSGSGVAFKLAWAICQNASGATRVTPEFRQFLVESVSLAALGMVADCVPLQDENRIIVRHGLARLAKTSSPGLKALLRIAGLAERSEIFAADVSFALAPRLNAAGRLGCARLVVELLTTSSPQHADELANTLEKLNAQRQEIEHRILDEAIQMMDGCASTPAIVLAKPNWHPGVIGIVAGRLAELYARPALVIGISNGAVLAQGSGRSVGGLALHAALEACQEHLVSHGGHAAAVGFRLMADRVDGFRDRFCEYVSANSQSGAAHPRLMIDAELPLHTITPRLVDAISRLEPYGAGNPRPCFLAGPVRIVGTPRAVGRGNRHLQFHVRQADTTVPAVAFNMADRAAELLSADGECCLAFTPSLNEYQGWRRLQLELTDFQPGSRAAFI